MEQLTFNIINKSKVEIIASSAYNFRIELLKEYFTFLNKLNDKKFNSKI